MRSVRTFGVLSVGCLALCVCGVMGFAQPPANPAPADAPKDQPAGDRPAGRPDGMRGQPGDGPRGQRGEGAGVRQGMMAMNRALRTLKANVGDAAKKDENLRTINDVQRGCVAAKGASPDRALGKMDEAKRKEAGAKYRRALIQIMEKALKAESAILDGKNEEAAKLVGEIEKLRDASHTEMGVGEDDAGGGRGGPGGAGSGAGR